MMFSNSCNTKNTCCIPPTCVQPGSVLASIERGVSEWIPLKLLETKKIGFQGFQGSTGTGVIGFQGFQGFIGTGTRGFQGGVGERGFQGFQGNEGIRGFQGSTGTGIRGFQGLQGDTGFQGSTGVGIRGFQGFQGIQGNTGTIGLQGTQGNTGIRGFQGTQGNTGTIGFQGTQGNTGIRGFQGTQGNTGTSGFQGAQGNTGTSGFQGVQGNTGTSGFQGVQGNIGIIGFQGPQASSTITSALALLTRSQIITTTPSPLSISNLPETGSPNFTLTSGNTIVVNTPGIYNASIFINISGGFLVVAPITTQGTITSVPPNFQGTFPLSANFYLYVTTVPSSFIFQASSTSGSLGINDGNAFIIKLSSL